MARRCELAILLAVTGLIGAGCGGTSRHPDSTVRLGAYSKFDLAFRRSLQIMLATVDGSQTAVIAGPLRHGGEWASPTFAPSGKRIAAIRYASSGVSHVIAMNVDGSGMTDLMPDADQPAWSPDGRQIAFVRYRSRSYIWVMSSTGADQHRTPLRTLGNPAWSPDGRLLAFDSPTGRPWACRGRIMIARPDGSGEHPVTPCGIYAVDATWSPNGDKLAFAGTTRTDRGVRLFVVNRNGAHLHPITRYGINVQAPAWSPDGTWIAFTGQHGPHNIGMLVHPDGTGMHKILGNASQIAWRPSEPSSGR